MSQQPPADYDFYVYQGSEFRVPIQFFQEDPPVNPFDLTGYEVDMHVRSRPAADVDSTILVALSTRTTGEGANRIRFMGEETTEGTEETTEGPADPTLGKIELLLTSEECAAIPWSGKARAIPAVVTYYYDLELVDADGRVVRVMRGKFTLDAEITKQSEA